MTEVKVALVDLGENLPVSISRLSRELGRRLKGFSFQPVQSITPGKMGNPTIDDEWYNVPDLFELLREHQPSKGANMVVGITHAKITEAPPSGTRDHRDYFCLSDRSSTSVISVNGAVSQYTPAGRSLYQYLAFLIVGELLINLARKDFMHSATHYCLFDDCEDRNDFTRGMEKGELCVECLARLDAKGVSHDVVTQVQSLLHWCRHISLRFAATETMRSAVTSLSLGTAAGWLCTTFLSKQYLILVLFVAALLPLFVFAKAKFKSR